MLVSPQNYMKMTKNVTINLNKKIVQYMPIRVKEIIIYDMMQKFIVI